MDKPVKKLTSFKKLPPAPAPSKPDVTQNPASLMTPADKMSGKVALTDFEKEALNKLGVDGDVTVLPSNIAEKIESVTSGLGNTINFDDLPEDKKKEISEFIKNAPTVSENNTENEPTASGVNIPKPVIIDDLEDKAKQEINAPLLKTVADVNGPAVICPHCGWDTRNKELTEVTDADKFDFVQSVLSGGRFKKVYKLFGDRLKIVFRTLTTFESDMAYKQIITDAQKDIHTKAIGDSAFYWRTLMAYRSIMAIERVESDSNIVEVPPISEIECDAPKLPDTKVSVLFDSLVEQIMPNEALRNAISHTYTEFNALCEKLQSMAESKDFWNAIK